MEIKTLTRTDFLLQFVWKPVKRDELPKTEEEEKAKIKELVDKMKEAEKNNPAVTMPKGEEIEAASLKKSEELDIPRLQMINAWRRRCWAPGASAPGPARRPRPSWPCQCPPRRK